MMKPDFDLKGFLYDPHPSPPDLRWLYVFLGLAVFALGIVSAVAIYIYRINARLLQEAADRKQAEETLRKSEARFRSYFQLPLLCTLAGGIARDFNNILLGLFGNIALAKEDLPKDNPGYASLEEAEKSMNRAVRLTKQLLTFAKGGEPVKETTRLGVLVEEVARFDLSGGNVLLDYRQGEGLWPAEVDKGQIQQVISNLTTNARQAMPEGGRLHITLENGEVAESAVVDLAAGPLPERTRRVLVMDDEETVRNLVSRMLQRSGFTAATAPDGQKAIELYRQAREAGTPFAAVIMDLTIPGGMGGKEAIKALLAIDPQVRAIVSGGYAGDPVMASFADYGFKGIAAKPYTQAELRSVLEEVLR
jgi:CheY-like chemotaxis protein